MREPDFPSDPEPQRIFTGRTGIGSELVIDYTGAWLDVRYIARDGEIRGFSVNPKYAAELTVALVGVLAERAQ